MFFSAMSNMTLTDSDQTRSRKKEVTSQGSDQHHSCVVSGGLEAPLGMSKAAPASPSKVWPAEAAGAEVGVVGREETESWSLCSAVCSCKRMA